MNLIRVLRSILCTLKIVDKLSELSIMNYCKIELDLEQILRSSMSTREAREVKPKEI